MARRIGDPAQQAAVQINLGEVLVAQGRLDEARQGYDTAIAVSQRLGHANFEAIAHMNLAYLHVESGDGATALSEIGLAQEGFAKIGASTYASEVLRYRALALLLLGDHAEALAAAQEALALAKDRQRSVEIGQALRVLGQVYGALGGNANRDEALSHFTASRVTLEGIGAGYELALTLWEQARMLAAAGLERPEWLREAQTCATEAAAVFRAAGATRYLRAAERL